MRRAPLAGVLLCLLSCQKAPAPAGRVTVGLLPAENLSAEPELDWLAAALPRLAAAQLAGARSVEAAAFRTEHDPNAGRAQQLLRSHFTRERGKLVWTGYLEETATRRMARRLRLEEEGDAGALRLAAAVARELGAPGPPPTANLEAARRYGEALETADGAQAITLLERAIAADPRFGLAYLALAEALAAGRNRAALESLAARARQAGAPEADRARIDLLAAQVAGDAASAAQALVAAAKAAPADAVSALRAGEAELALHRIAEAAKWFERAAAADPQSRTAWNSLGYCKAYLGDYEGAKAALERYRAIAPRDPNGLDSLGEAAQMAGRFGEAEKRFLEAATMDPAFLQGAPLYKAAFARLLAGDVPGADGLFERYRKAAGADPLLPVKSAHWDWLAGRREKALAAAVTLAAAPESSPAASELAARGLVFGCVWKLAMGDRAGASQDAAKAAGTGGASPGVQAFAQLCRFLALPAASPEEWKRRAAGLPGPLRDLGLGYALLADGHYAAATVPLGAAYAATPPARWEEVRLALGLALAESGRKAEAAARLALYPLAPGLGDSALSSLVFPKVLEWRGKVASAR